MKNFGSSLNRNMKPLYILNETTSAEELSKSFYQEVVLGFYDIDNDKIVIIDSGFRRNRLST